MAIYNWEHSLFSLLRTHPEPITMAQDSIITQTVFLVMTLTVVAMVDSAKGSTLALQRPNVTAVLMVHNRARAKVGVAPLRWSNRLEVGARLQGMYQRDEKKCHLIHYNSTFPYGINQDWASWPRTVEEAVGEWVKEKKFYNYASNSCPPLHECGDYTQVVWKGSLEVGCGQIPCYDEAGSLIICFYNPPGNIEGERPYHSQYSIT